MASTYYLRGLILPGQSFIMAGVDNVGQTYFLVDIKKYFGLVGLSNVVVNPGLNSNIGFITLDPSIPDLAPGLIAQAVPVFTHSVTPTRQVILTNGNNTLTQEDSNDIAILNPFPSASNDSFILHSVSQKQEEAVIEVGPLYNMINDTGKDLQFNNINVGRVISPPPGAVFSDFLLSVPIDTVRFIPLTQYSSLGSGVSGSCMNPIVSGTSVSNITSVLVNENSWLDNRTLPFKGYTLQSECVNDVFYPYCDHNQFCGACFGVCSNGVKCTLNPGNKTDPFNCGPGGATGGNGHHGGKNLSPTVIAEISFVVIVLLILLVLIFIFAIGQKSTPDTSDTYLDIY